MTGAINIPELSPCPFCGGRAKFCNELGDYSKPPQDFRIENGIIVWGCYIECSRCGCTLGKGHWNSQECFEGDYSTFEEAAKAWDTRK